MPRGEFTKKGCASEADSPPAVGYRKLRPGISCSPSHATRLEPSSLGEKPSCDVAGAPWQGVTGMSSRNMFFLVPKFPMLNAPNSAYYARVMPNYTQLCRPGGQRPCRTWPMPTEPAPTLSMAALSNTSFTSPLSGASLVHFSAQPEPFPTQNTPYIPPNTRSHLLYIP
jgi:hypothetical protein